MSTMSRKFRELLAHDNFLVLPGCYDCITGRLVERSGAGAAYMSGGATSFAYGYPDYGLITQTEMVENAGRIATALGIPVIADADTGYGNVLNVTRTIREYEARGVAGVHIEDQIFPKKCGHLDGKQLVPQEEFLQKIRAAVEARRNRDFVIIARTDACAVTGFEDALARAAAAFDAGADMAFVEAIPSLELLAEAPRRLSGPVMLNLVWNGKTPNISTAEAARMGYKAAIAPGLLLRELIAACETALATFNETGLHRDLERDWNVSDLFKSNDAEQWDAIRARYD